MQEIHFSFNGGHATAIVTELPDEGRQSRVQVQVDNGTATGCMEEMIGDKLPFRVEGTHKEAIVRTGRGDSLWILYEIELYFTKGNGRVTDRL